MFGGVSSGGTLESKSVSSRGWEVVENVPVRACGRILKGKLRQGRWGRVERGPLRGSKVIRLSVECVSVGCQVSNVQ